MSIKLPCHIRDASLRNCTYHAQPVLALLPLSKMPIDDVCMSAARHHVVQHCNDKFVHSCTQCIMCLQVVSLKGADAVADVHV